MCRRALHIAVIVLCGCSSEARHGVAYRPQAVGDVSGSIIKALPQDQYASKPGAYFDLPATYADNASPIYPAQLLPAKLPPVRIRVRIVVDESGSVISVTPLDGVPPEQQAFLLSVQTALIAWHFWPLVQITAGPGTSEVSSSENESKQYSGSAKPLPFYQDYVFVFRQHDGEGTSSAQ